MTIWHCMIAMSLDGLIARPDGSVDWLEPYPPEAFGVDEFLASIDAIVMGRGTYDAVRAMGVWPYGTIPTVVLTSRPIEEAPESVEAHPGDAAALAALLESRGHKRVWIEGGGEVVRSFLNAGKLDVLEVAIIPIVLGDGIPLFPAGTPETVFTLTSSKTVMGALHLIYERVASPSS